VVIEPERQGGAREAMGAHQSHGERPEGLWDSLTRLPALSPGPKPTPCLLQVLRQLTGFPGTHGGPPRTRTATLPSRSSRFRQPCRKDTILVNMGGCLAEGTKRTQGTKRKRLLLVPWVPFVPCGAMAYSVTSHAASAITARPVPACVM